MTKNRDLWAKVADERLGEIGRLKEALDAMWRERNEALAEVTVARAIGGEPASGEITRLRAELARAAEERDAAHRACDRMDKAFNESQDNSTRAARMVASRDKEIETLSSELLKCVSQRNTEAAEVSRLKVDLSVAITERNQARSEREKITAAFEAYVALDEDDEFDDLTDEELDAADVTEEDFDEDEGGAPDSILSGELAGKIGMASDRIDGIGNALFNLGTSVDRQAGRIDAVTEAVRGLTARFERHEEGANRRLAESETNISHILTCVEFLFGKFDHPKLVALLRTEIPAG